MKRRGISPAIATLVLIGVAVVGAITAGNAMQAQNEISAKMTKAEVIDSGLVKLQVANRSYFAATVKNTGTTTVNFISVGFLDDSGTFQSASANNVNLDPGQQWSTYFVANVDVTPSQRYALHLDVSTDTATTGSTFRIADTIVARG